MSINQPLGKVVCIIVFLTYDLKKLKKKNKQIGNFNILLFKASLSTNKESGTVIVHYDVPHGKSGSQ